MRNLHKIMGSKFRRFKPLLCPTCKHFYKKEDVKGYEWDEFCLVTGKILSAPKNETPKRNTCQEYEATNAS